MLEIELSDGSGKLDVDTKQQKDFEQNFNIHNFEHIEGSKSWRFKLIKTPNNLQKVGFINIPEIKSDFVDNVKVNLVINGTLWKQGLLYFEDDQKGYWNVYFVGDTGILKNLIGKRKLTDFQYPVVTGLPDVYAHAKRVADDGNAFDDYTFASVSTPKINNLSSFHINHYKFNVSTGEWDGFLDKISGDYAAIVPFPYVKKVLGHIGTELNITFGGTLWDDEEFARLIFFNTVSLTTFVNGEPIGAPTGTIDIKNHLPEIELSNFLKDIAKLFNQIVVYDDRESTITFIHRTELLSLPINTALQYKTTSITSRYREKRRYSFLYDFDEDLIEWVNQRSSVPADLSGVDADEDSNEIKTLFSTLPTMVEPSPDYFSEAVSWNEINEKVPTILLFSRGFAEIDNAALPGVSYIPLALSNLEYNPAPTFTIDKYSLTWKGNTGLYNVWWDPYLKSLKLARVLVVRFLFTQQDWVNFDFLQRHAFLRYVCIFEEMEITFTDNMAKVEAQVLSL